MYASVGAPRRDRAPTRDAHHLRGYSRAMACSVLLVAPVGVSRILVIFDVLLRIFRRSSRPEGCGFTQHRIQNIQRVFCLATRTSRVAVVVARAQTGAAGGCRRNAVHPGAAICQRVRQCFPIGCRPPLEHLSPSVSANPPPVPEPIRLSAPFHPSLPF